MVSGPWGRVATAATKSPNERLHPTEIACSGANGGDGGPGLGGAVNNLVGTMTLSDSSLMNNTATGGRGGGRGRGGLGGNGGNSLGGIHVTSGATAALTDSMIKDNAATGGAAGAGGTAGLGQGGGVYVASTAAATANKKTMVKNNTAS